MQRPADSAIFIDFRTNNHEGTAIYRKLANNVIFSSGYNITVRLTLFIAGIYIARSLGVAEFGKYSFILAFLFFFETPINEGLGKTMVKELSQKRELAGELLGSSILLYLITAFLGLMAACIIYFLIPSPPVSIFLLLYAGIYIPLRISSVYQYYFQASFDINKHFTIELAQAFGFIIFLFLLFRIEQSLFNAVSAYILRFLMGILVIILLFKDTVPVVFSISKRAMKRLISGMWLLGFTSLLWTSFSLIDQILLGIMSTSRELGYYSSAYRITSSAEVLITPFMLTLYPALSRTIFKEPGKFRQIYKLTAQLLTITGIVFAWGMSLFSFHIIKYTFGPSFFPALSAFIILAWYHLIRFITITLAYTLMAGGHYKYLLGITLLSNILNIGLNLYLIPRYGGVGAAWSTFISMLIILAPALLSQPSPAKEHIPVFLRAVFKPLLALVPTILAIMWIHPGPVARLVMFLFLFPFCLSLLRTFTFDEMRFLISILKDLGRNKL